MERRISSLEASYPSVLSHWTAQLTVQEDELRKAILGRVVSFVLVSQKNRLSSATYR